MVIRKRVAQMKQTTTSTKRWRPCMDVNDNPSYYQQMLDDKMNADFPQTLGNVERIIYEAATTDGVRIIKQDREKLWHSDDLKTLIQRRKICGTKYKKTQLSKSNQNFSRQIYVNTTTTKQF